MMSSSLRFHARFHVSQVIHRAHVSRSVCSLHSPRINPAAPTLSFTSHTTDRHYRSSSVVLDARNHRHHRSNPETNTGRTDVANLTRQLLSDSTTNNCVIESYKVSLEQARTDESLIKSFGLSKSDAQSMYIMPPNILRDVHLAVSHFSKRDNYQGISFGTHNIPGPVLCVQLLGLIGIPQYYSDQEMPVSSALSPRPVIVHSSQIDQILHCCLQTALALSNSCKAGKGTLIGYDFNSSGKRQYGGKKTAAHVCEEIWRAVHSMEIKFTFERKGENPTLISPIQMPNILSNLNSISAMSDNPLMEYFADFIPQNTEPWSKKDHRRYKQAISLFNSTLAAYARLGSSATGTQQGIRREMVQSTERILLELAAKNNAADPSPSTILQCVRPDIISFNSAMNAWSQLGPRLKGAVQDKHTESIAILSAEKSQAFLEMMQELWDEERSMLSTRQAMQSTWEQCANEESLQVHAVAPNTSSYNTVLFAYSRSSSSDSYDKAMRLFKIMVDRCNLSCNGRISFMRQNSNSHRVDDASLEGDHAYPDSRTFVALLGCCSNMRSKSFSDAANIIETVYDTMKYWNEQLRWSTRQGITPDELLRAQEQTNPILNVFAYNALIKAYASIPKSSWDESLQCCNRIDEIISSMGVTAAPDDITRGIAIDAWIQCADFANLDPARHEICVEKACAHLDSMLLPQTMPFHQLTQQYGDSAIISSRALHSLNDVISLCGKLSMPSRAYELFLRAKECNISNLVILSSTIDALTKSKDIVNVKTALHHLIEFEKFLSKTRTAESNKKHEYTCMYNACIKGFLNVENGTENAHKLLMRMIHSHDRSPFYIGQPNPTSFALVMDALAKSGRSKEVESLLTKMEELDQRRQNNPRGKDLELNVAPNIIHYNTLMTSYVRGNHAANLESAEKLYYRMQNDSRLPSPDEITTSLYLQLQSGVQSNISKSLGRVYSDPNRAVHASQQASDTNNIELDELILDTIKQDHNPSPKSFTAIMNGFVNRRTIEGTKKATELLRRMEEMFAAGDIKIRPGKFNIS
jgi:hypothetical protein